MSEQNRSWIVSSSEVTKWLSRSPKELIKEMKEFGVVSSATREIVARMAIPEATTAQISLTPVVPGMTVVRAETPPLWAAFAIFLDRHNWMARMMEVGVRRIVVMHPVQDTGLGRGRLSVGLNILEVEGVDGEFEQEVTWDISLTFIGGEVLVGSAQAHEEADFFGVPLSQLGEKVVPQAKVLEIRTA